MVPSMDEVELPKATDQLRGDSLLFAPKFPETSSTHLINLGRIQAESNLEPLCCFDPSPVCYFAALIYNITCMM